MNIVFLDWVLLHVNPKQAGTKDGALVNPTAQNHKEKMLTTTEKLWQANTLNATFYHGFCKFHITNNYHLCH